MSEIKTPQAGELWETRSGERAYVAASLHAAGKIPYSEYSELTGWSMAGGSISGRSWSRNGQWFAGCDGEHDLVKHLPDCTGWDWKEPDWAPLDPETYGWHKLRLKVDQCCGEITGGQWEPVMFESRKPLADFSDLKFRCERKDLPIKPPAKPDPGEGFRLLEPDEKVIKGDEYYEPRGTPRWEKSDNWRYRNGEQSSELVYRRRKEKPSAVVSLDTYEKVVAERNALQDRLREIEAKAKF